MSSKPSKPDNMEIDFLTYRAPLHFHSPDSNKPMFQSDSNFRLRLSSMNTGKKDEHLLNRFNKSQANNYLKSLR